MVQECLRNSKWETDRKDHGLRGEGEKRKGEQETKTKQKGRLRTRAKQSRQKHEEGTATNVLGHKMQTSEKRRCDVRKVGRKGRHKRKRTRKRETQRETTTKRDGT